MKSLKFDVPYLTTLHGLSHFTKIKGKSFYVWTFMMIINLLLTIGFLMIVKERYYSNEIVTQIHHNCNVIQVPFPTVSICNFNVASFKNTKTIKHILSQYNRSEEEIIEFFQTLPLLTYSRFEVDQQRNFTEIMRILKNHYYTTDIIMEEIHQKCEDLLLYCSFNRKKKKCSHLFTMTKTYDGFCCAFNYAGTSDATSSLFDEDFEYYDDNSEDLDTHIIATSESGRLSGLFVILDIEPDDYPPWSHTHSYGAKILITDPNDFPESNLKYQYLSIGETIEIKVAPMIIQADSALRRVDVLKRNCWFHDEVPLKSTYKYSVETCMTECRINTFLKHCNCVPYKYPRDVRFRVCELEDLKCLNNVTVSTSNSEMNCDPVCFVECHDKKYSITTTRNTLMSEDIPEHLMKHDHLSRMSALRVYFANSSCNTYKMTVLFDISHMIATYGGVFSLFFGGSILTITELFYIFIKSVIILIGNIAKRVTMKCIPKL